jgi:predicted phosphodiesterase
MKVLAISDIVIDWIYSPQIRTRFSDVNLAIGCGDLPQYYLEYIINALDTCVLCTR